MRWPVVCCVAIPALAGCLVTGDYTNTPTSADSVSTRTIIGRGEIADVDLFLGDIDEVRLAHRLRSDDFIAADYRSTSDQMVSFGAAVPVE